MLPKAIASLRAGLVPERLASIQYKPRLAKLRPKIAAILDKTEQVRDVHTILSIPCFHPICLFSTLKISGWLNVLRVKDTIKKSRLIMSAHGNQEITDPVEEMLKKTGCMELHFKVQECIAETQDWRKCQGQVQDFKKCMQEYQEKRLKGELLL